MAQTWTKDNLNATCIKKSSSTDFAFCSIFQAQEDINTNEWESSLCSIDLFYLSTFIMYCFKSLHCCWRLCDMLAGTLTKIISFDILLDSSALYVLYHWYLINEGFFPSWWTTGNRELCENTYFTFFLITLC